LQKKEDVSKPLSKKFISVYNLGVASSAATLVSTNLKKPKNQ